MRTISAQTRAGVKSLRRTVLLAALLPILAAAQPAWNFRFVPLANSGPGPGGVALTGDFVPGGINNRGQGAFSASLASGGAAVFVFRNAGPVPIALSGQPGPGGGVFGGGVLGNVASNANGEAAFAFSLDPFSFPIGANVGAYRYSDNAPRFNEDSPALINEENGVGKGCERARALSKLCSKHRDDHSPESIWSPFA